MGTYQTRSYTRLFRLIDPNGKEHIGSNLSKFCREKGLDRGTIYRVLQGELRQHKGWTVKDEDVAA